MITGDKNKVSNVESFRVSHNETTLEVKESGVKKVDILVPQPELVPLGKIRTRTFREDQNIKTLRLVQVRQQWTSHFFIEEVKQNLKEDWKFPVGNGKVEKGDLCPKVLILQSED